MHNSTPLPTSAAYCRCPLALALWLCGCLGTSCKTPTAAPDAGGPSTAAQSGNHATATAGLATAGSAGPHSSVQAGSVAVSATGGAEANAATAGHAGCSGSGCSDPANDAGPDLPEDGSVMTQDAGTLRMPNPKYLVPATGPCPEFRNDYVTFKPDGVSRSVLLFISDKATGKHGPLVISWHSTIPTPESATQWLSNEVIEEIKAMGGVVAAPATGYPNETRPWDNTPMGAQNTDGDQRLMDEIVACATQKVGIDLRRIHSIGMSAGGLKTAQVSLRRSGYLASVVVYSGGLTQGDMPPDQDPDNKFAAMILYGGATDISPVDGIPYTDASRTYRDLLLSKGRFAFLCNHGGGHNVPSDSQPSAWRFMQDHPFGTSPSPYAMQLPSGFLRYCSLN